MSIFFAATGCMCDETSKDVSSFANTQGGLIIFGIEEAKDPDGSRRPKARRPLDDGDAPKRLEDVLLQRCRPNVVYRDQRIDAPQGGFYPVLEIENAWPINPFTGADMKPGSGRGDFHLVPVERVLLLIASACVKDPARCVAARLSRGRARSLERAGSRGRQEC